MKVLLLVLVPGTINRNSIENGKHTNKQQTTNTHTHTMNKIKTADKDSISNTESKSREIGLKETESNKALPGS